MQRSILTEKIARRGYHIYREYGVDPLERHHVDEVMTRTVETIDADLTVREALATFFGVAQSASRVSGGARRRGDRHGRPGDARTRPCFERRDALRGAAPVVALPGETCRLVATRLAVHGLERLPVVADNETRRLVGIVSRSDLVKPSLAHFDEEHKRERFRRIGRGGGSAFAKRRRAGSR